MQSIITLEEAKSFMHSVFDAEVVVLVKEQQSDTKGNFCTKVSTHCTDTRNA